MLKVDIESYIKIIDEELGDFIVATPSFKYSNCIEISCRLPNGDYYNLGDRLILSNEQCFLLCENILSVYNSDNFDQTSKTIIPKFDIFSAIQEEEKIISLEDKIIELEKQLQKTEEDLYRSKQAQYLIENNDLKQVINELNAYKIDYEAEMQANQDLRVKFKALRGETTWEMWDRIEKTLKDNNLL